MSYSFLSRRQFLKAGAAITASACASPFVLRAQSPGDRMRVGFVGLGHMGRSDSLSFSRISDLVALADIDEAYGIVPAMKLKGIADSKPDIYSDYRKILDRKDIDIIGIATPDHWHTKIAIEALTAGKHVFCEKPLTLTIEEGALIRNASRKYKKVFQVGNMQRASQVFQTAVLIVRKGFLGDIKRVVCQIDGGDVSDGPIPKAEVPATLDWNTWLGQASYRDYLATAERTERPNFLYPKNTNGHHQFRWWYDFAGGKFTDWGAHHVDIALWALKMDKLGLGPEAFIPSEVVVPVPHKDGYPTVHDQYQTPTKFRIDCPMPGGILLQVVSDMNLVGLSGGNGLFFEGTKGNMHVSRARIKGNVYENEKVQDTFTEDDYSALAHGKTINWKIGDLDRHKQNMIDCIKEGGLSISEIEANIQGINLCHAACIATRLNRKLVWDAKTDTFVDDAQACAFLAREQRKGFEIPRV